MEVLLTLKFGFCNFSGQPLIWVKWATPQLIVDVYWVLWYFDFINFQRSSFRDYLWRFLYFRRETTGSRESVSLWMWVWSLWNPRTTLFYSVFLNWYPFSYFWFRNFFSFSLVCRVQPNFSSWLLDHGHIFSCFNFRFSLWMVKRWLRMGISSPLGLLGWASYKVEEKVLSAMRVAAPPLMVA